MKIMLRDIKHGKIAVIPEVLDDLWVLYNLILRGDTVYAKTTREVRYGERYERPEKGERISVVLGLNVENASWDGSLNRLRIHGIVYDAPDEIGAKGSHHTINVTLNEPLTIVKEKWLKYHLDRLEKATETGVSPVIVVSIDDERYCIAVLRQFNIDVKAQEAARIPGKQDAEGRAKAFDNFFRSALSSLREVWSTNAYSIVIIGLGFTKNEFVKYLREKAPEVAEKVTDVKSVHSSGATAISEALRSGILTKVLRQLRISEETKLVEEILLRLGKGEGYATYGFSEAKKACTFGAVETLLVTDARLRESSDEQRAQMEDLMRMVEEKRGRIVIVSTAHEAGAKLRSLGEVAALLRFPIN